MKKTCLFLTFAIVATLFASPSAQAAADWPNRTVTMIVPFAAGGTTDVLGRALAQSLSEELGQKFIVKNVSGGNGAVGAAEAAQMKPDGYTIAFLPVGPAALMWQQRKIPYDNKSFVPVAQVAANPTALHVRNDSFKTLKELIDHLKANPDGNVPYGSSGAGSQPHIAGMMLLQAIGVKAKHIPNTDGATSIKDLLGGVTEFNMNPVTYVDLNDITALVIFSAERDPKYPNVMSLPETGVFPKGSEPYSDTWIGMFVPTGTSKATINKLESTIEKIMKDPKFIDVSMKTRQTLKWRNAKDFAAFVDAECAKYTQVLGEAGLLRR